LLTHYGSWVQPPRRQVTGPTPKPRWMPLPHLLYAQVVKTVGRVPVACGQIQETGVATVPGAKRPRRAGPHGLPAAVSPVVTPSTPALRPHVACSVTAPCRFLPPCVLIPPLVVARVARGSAVPRVSSRRGPSVPPPWLAYRAATAARSPGRWCAPAVAGAGARGRGCPILLVRAESCRP